MADQMLHYVTFKRMLFDSFTKQQPHLKWDTNYFCSIIKRGVLLHLINPTDSKMMGKCLECEGSPQRNPEKSAVRVITSLQLCLSCFKVQNEPCLTASLQMIVTPKRKQRILP